MIRLDAATVLLQWATGISLFGWVTTRRRQVGIGYGWLLRITTLVLAASAVACGQLLGPVPFRDACAVLVTLAATVALAVSVVRRRAGVAGERALRERRAERVAAMMGNPDQGPAPPGAEEAEFPPALDLVAPAVGALGLVAAGLAAGGPDVLAVARTLVGAAFLGAVTDAMLLGHWYLVQPKLGRGPLGELNRWVARLWPVEVAVLLWPTGMLSVLSGTIDDGYGGILGWFWLACAVSTLTLTFVTRAALRERAYSAVMAATGLLYLAILTAFGTDLVARALLAGA
ncbi:MAG: hypothetical protein M3378_11315 [Actinomycetota bacterium]|nr:hypothetical protein [Actinomycetota bacterium]MDQ3681104.1 hypothetical protein [Actinomycetota bacterium]